MGTGVENVITDLPQLVTKPTAATAMKNLKQPELGLQHVIRRCGARCPELAVTDNYTFHMARKFGGELYFGGLAVLKAIHQYFICQNVQSSSGIFLFK